MKKYINTSDGFKEIEDYGIVEFLHMNEDGRIYKYMGFIYEDEYAASYAPASEAEHSDLGNEIKKEFGDNYNVCVGAQGKVIDFNRHYSEDNIPIDVIENILEDIRYYYKKYNKDVIIKMNNFDNIDDKEHSCDQIDEIISSLDLIKNVRSRN